MQTQNWEQVNQVRHSFHEDDSWSKKQVGDLGEDMWLRLGRGVKSMLACGCKDRYLDCFYGFR